MSNTIVILSYQEELKGLINQLGEMLPAAQFGVFNADARQLGEEYQTPLNLQAGAQAPDFSLPNGWY